MADIGNLILHRKQGESIRIGDNIVVKIIEIRHGQVRVGVEAPRDMPVHRGEIWLKVRQEMAELERHEIGGGEAGSA